MPLRLPRFRLRTILIAIVFIGLVLSRCEFEQSERVTAFRVVGIGVSHVGIHVPSQEEHELTYQFFGETIEPFTIWYSDLAAAEHRLSALFSFKECPCCGKSWEWDGEKYVE